jgi:hypothetical protein
LIAGVIDRAKEVGETGGLGFDQQDIGPRRDGVCPLHVEGDFQGPPRIGSGSSLRRRLGEYGVAQAEGLVEDVQVAGNSRVVEGVNDGDGLARAVAFDRTKHNLIEPIGVPDLRGGEDGQQVARFELLDRHARATELPDRPCDALLGVTREHT